MKKYILGLLLVLVCVNNSSATECSDSTFTKVGNTFTSVKSSSSNDEKTSYFWQDGKGEKYPIYLHKYTKGENIGQWTAYVFKTSKKTGKEYKYYIPNGKEIATSIINSKNKKQ